MFLRHHRWFSLCKVPASTLIQSLNDVSHIWYKLWCLCDMLSWSVSLRYQLVRRYNVSNWSVSHTYQWDVQKPSQNRSVSLVYQLWDHDHISAWSVAPRFSHSVAYRLRSLRTSAVYHESLDRLLYAILARLSLVLRNVTFTWTEWILHWGGCPNIDHIFYFMLKVLHAVMT